MKLLDVTDPLLHHLQKEKETKKLEKEKRREAEGVGEGGNSLNVHLRVAGHIGDPLHLAASLAGALAHLQVNYRWI